VSFSNAKNLIFGDCKPRLQDRTIYPGKQRLRKRLQKPWWTSAEHKLQWWCWGETANITHRSINQGTLHKTKDTQNIHPIFLTQAITTAVTD